MHHDVPDVGAGGALANPLDAIVREFLGQGVEQVDFRAFAELIGGLLFKAALQVLHHRSELLLFLKILRSLLADDGSLVLLHRLAHFGDALVDFLVAVGFQVIDLRK